MTVIFDPTKNTIFLDMDGVLADFDRFVLEKMGRIFFHEKGPEGDKEMWDFLTTVDHLYGQLEPTPYAFDLWTLANSFGANVEILTALPHTRHVPEAEQDKRDWMKKYFGEVKFNIGPYSDDKWKHAKRGDILVDDRAANITAWINKGHGIGILHDYEDYPSTEVRLKRLANELQESRLPFIKELSGLKS
jgi:5'(3')-deoxyribonucleotidase